MSNVVRTGEVWRINDKEKLTNVHKFEDCVGPCPLHSPSDHMMVDWTLNWRQDAGIFERMCEHGIGHPDPDSVAYVESLTGSDAWKIHGCDGCCEGAYV